MSLLQSLARAIRSKRGERCIRLRRGWGDTKGHMCRRCGHTIHHVPFPGHKGSSIPESHGCERCDGVSLRSAYTGHHYRSFSPGESARMVGISSSRAIRGMLWLMKENRR